MAKKTKTSPGAQREAYERAMRATRAARPCRDANGAVGGECGRCLAKDGEPCKGRSV